MKYRKFPAALWDCLSSPITHSDVKIRQQSLDYLRKMAEIALEMNCKILNMWMAQDGYDYLLTTDYNQKRQWLCEYTTILAQEFPSLKFALEYKPKKPRNFSFHARMSDTILAAKETNCPNVGITIDTGHGFAAGENIAESVVLVKRAGNLLYHMHFNDNHGIWDDDMIVASVHSTIYIDLLYWLRKTGYDGFLSMDQYPYREDAVDAISESILWVKRFEEIVNQNFAELDELVKLNDAVSTSRFMRKVLFGK